MKRLIEWQWKFFKKNVTYDKYYEKFPDFRDACKKFLQQHQKVRDSTAQTTYRT
ncbi:MAG: hypothetical protein LBC02_12695 [Planctomycetaceae bacterium]|nr:hypothetical protein [Planctomycetaceae bacterium]